MSFGRSAPDRVVVASSGPAYVVNILIEVLFQQTPGCHELVPYAVLSLGVSFIMAGKTVG
jgi:hypothetical protein